MPLSISGCGRKQEALRATGWRNYSLFLRADGLLIGYVESDDLAAAQRAMDQTAVNARWQRDMARFFGTDAKPADQDSSCCQRCFTCLTPNNSRRVTPENDQPPHRRFEHRKVSCE